MPPTPWVIPPLIIGVIKATHITVNTKAKDLSEELLHSGVAGGSPPPSFQFREFRSLSVSLYSLNPQSQSCSRTLSSSCILLPTWPVFFPPSLTSYP